jgi:dinuclear metal center YbgI/SA1388 family protein
MVSLSKIRTYLDKELNIKKIKDSSKNGLQVKCNQEVKRIGFAVDGCLSTFIKAKKLKIDLLIVHHGIRWKPQKYKEITKKREEFLKKNNISLYGAHLPLDAHENYGNNIELCRLLNLKKTKKFGRYNGFKIGYNGIFNKPVSIGYISDKISDSLKIRCNVYSFGRKKIRSIAIVSGGGASSIEEAIKKNLDCFLVGEIDQGAYCRIRDYKLNVITAGHYATETLGVKALMQPLKEKFNVQTIFIDNPTGI